MGPIATLRVRFGLACLAGFLLPGSSACAGSAEFMDAEIFVYDDRFHDLIDAHSRVEILAGELEWAEGPVWVESLDALLFSDVAADRVYRWDESSGLSEYLSPSGHAPDDLGSSWRGSNGLAIDENGALLLAQQANRTLSRMAAPLGDPAPDYEVLASQYDGRALNSPNDLVVHRSGYVYFTDPPYGLDGFEDSPDMELDFSGVFRLTRDGSLVLVTREVGKPNGIALSPDQSTLYVSNSEEDEPQILAIDLDSQGNSTSSRVLFDGRGLTSDGPGSTDGMTVHPNGCLFVSIPNGLGVLSAKGELLGKIALGQVTNMTLDGSHSYLYITSPKRLMRLGINPTR